MIKKTITYLDLNGIERKEDFYFALNKAELMEMELGTTGGFTDMVQKIIDAKDQPALMKLFKEFVLKSYGIKSDDGRRFIKNDRVREEFEQTEAYSIIYMELLTDAKKAAEFVNGVVPSDIADQAAKKQASMMQLAGN